MSSLQRRVGMLILITLFISPTMLFAQENTPVTVVGSGIPAPLIQAFADTASAPVDLTVTGTNEGFAALCRGDADLTTATRAISAEEENACRSSGVDFLELVAGYDVMAVIANPSSDFGTCLSSLELNQLFAPSSTVSNWSELGTENANIPLSLSVPPENTTPFALLDSLVEGVGVRADVNTAADSQAVIDTVSSTSGAIGVVSLPAAQAASDAVTILDLNTTSAGCASPSADNAANRTYSAAYTFYLYVNAARLEAAQPLLDAAFSADNADVFAAQSFIAPTAANTALDQQIVANSTTGRQFSKDVTAFNIPANLVGTINIAGSAAGSDYMTAVTGAFVQQYPGVTLNQTIDGEPNGIRRLCNGEVDLITAVGDLTAEQQENCAANNIPLETIDLGVQAVVVLGHGDFLTCLTTDQLTTVWGAPSENTITNWNQVNENFPDTPITLVAPSPGDVTGDLLMFLSSGQNLPTRIDMAEAKADPAYRTTAIGNVPGGMTYMSWQDYTRLNAETQARATLMDVSGENGCVTPTAETITDGTYPLSRPIKLVINRLSMAREDVQSLLWYIASDANYAQLESNGITGMSFGSLPDLRDRLQQTFLQAADEARQAALATPEATVEAAADAEASSAADVAAEPTAESTAE